jgi:hypothetical protein
MTFINSRLTMLDKRDISRTIKIMSGPNGWKYEIHPHWGP